MTKSTKRPLPVSKTIQFQQHQKIKDISVSGKDALTSVDFSERDGDFKLKVKADPDKLNEVTGTPFVTTTVTTADEGTDDPKKSVTLGHDYRGLNVETAGKYLTINKTKDKAVIDGTLIEQDLTKALNDAKEAKEKADSLETSFNNVSRNLQDHAMDEAQLNSLTAKLDTTTTTANTAKESADTATVLAQQAKATADKTASDLGLAQAKEIEDIKNVNGAVERLRAAVGQTNGKLQGRLSELAQKIEKANAGATAPEPLKVDDATYNAIKAAKSLGDSRYDGITTATFVVNGQNVIIDVTDTNEVANFDTSIEGRILPNSPRSSIDNNSESLVIGLKGDTHEVVSIKIKSGHRDIEKRLLGVRDWLNFVPTKAEKALLELSQAGGRTNFTQEQVDQGIIVSEGLMVDMGKYWLPVGNVELAFGGDKPTAQELLDFTIYTYDLDTARVSHIKANTLLEPGTKVPPIIKTVY